MGECAKERRGNVCIGRKQVRTNENFWNLSHVAEEITNEENNPYYNQKYDPSIYYPMMAMVQVTTYHSLCLDKALASNKQDSLRGVRRCIFGELGDKSKM